MGALLHGAVADALATVRACQAVVTTKRAFEFLVLTAARSGGVRLATWDEMDLDAGPSTIPAARMKAKRDHRVPLSGRALAILHDVQRLIDGTGLVFRRPRWKPLSNMTLWKLIKELGIAAVPHGFRSSFRDWAAEQTNTPREVVQAALAHTVQNPTEAAYARSDLFERRRGLMDEWAAYLSGTHASWATKPPKSSSTDWLTFAVPQLSAISSLVSPAHLMTQPNISSSIWVTTVTSYSALIMPSIPLPTTVTSIGRESVARRYCA